MCKIAWSCVFACLASVIGDTLYIAATAKYAKDSNLQSSSSFDEYKTMDSTFIKEEWGLRQDLGPLEIASGMFNAATWIILCIPMVQVVWKLSLGGTHMVGLHTSIAVVTLCGAVAEFLAHMMFVGSAMTMVWLSEEFNLSYWTTVQSFGDQPDDIGWRTLEVLWLSIGGLLLFVDAVEWLFLGVILFLLFLSIQRQQVSTDASVPGGGSPFFLSLAFGGFSLFLSLVSLIDFAFEILRFKSWTTFAELAWIITIISRMIFWPTWLLWLGKQLARPLPPMTNYGAGPTAAGAPQSEQDEILS